MTWPCKYLPCFKEQSSLEGKGQLQEPSIQDSKPKEKDCPPGLMEGMTVGVLFPAKDCRQHKGSYGREQKPAGGSCQGSLSGRTHSPRAWPQQEVEGEHGPRCGCWIPGIFTPAWEKGSTPQTCVDSFLDSSTRSCPSWEIWGRRV